MVSQCRTRASRGLHAGVERGIAKGAVYFRRRVCVAGADRHTPVTNAPELSIYPCFPSEQLCTEQALGSRTVAIFTAPWPGMFFRPVHDQIAASHLDALSISKELVNRIAPARTCVFLVDAIGHSSAEPPWTRSTPEPMAGCQRRPSAPEGDVHVVRFVHVALTATRVVANSPTALPGKPAEDGAQPHNA